MHSTLVSTDEFDAEKHELEMLAMYLQQVDLRGATCHHEHFLLGLGQLLL